MYVACDWCGHYSEHWHDTVWLVRDPGLFPSMRLRDVWPDAEPYTSATYRCWPRCLFAVGRNFVLRMVETVGGRLKGSVCV